MITAFVINSIFNGNITNFFLFYMLGTLTAIVGLMYYPKPFVNYFSNGEIRIVSSGMMTSKQYWKMLWTITLIGEVVSMVFLFGIGYNVVQNSILLMTLGLSLMKIYVIYTLFSGAKGNQS